MNAPSVVVCSVRQDDDLLAALASLDEDADPGAEIVVVRSGSAPGSPLPERLSGWVSDAAVRRPVRVVELAELGAAPARIAGLEAAGDDRVLFVDDDVIIRPGWYAAMAAGFENGAAAVGGTILPRWPDREPRWLHPRLAVYYGERFAGAYNEHLPFGASMGLRRDLVEVVGGIRRDLGVVGTLPGMHEETEICARLRLAGYRVEDIPEAVVVHRVRREQVHLRWLLRRAWQEGRADARRDGWIRAELVLRAAKLAGLVAAWPAAAFGRRRLTYVSARILVNAGYLWERFDAREGRGAAGFAEQ